jgi:hypothetical protein
LVQKKLILYGFWAVFILSVFGGGNHTFVTLYDENDQKRGKRREMVLTLYVFYAKLPISS